MKKFVFWSGMIFVSIIISILCSYIYGYFMHGRYWGVTIPAVQEKEIDLIRNILETDLSKMVKEDNFSGLQKLFKPIDGKLFVEALYNGRVVYHNREINYEINFYRKDIPVPTPYGQLIFKIATYKPPTWNYQFSNWLQIKNIRRWLTTKYDFITYSFLAFLGIWFFGLFSFAMWYKARHESNLLKEILEELSFGQEKRE